MQLLNLPYDRYLRPPNELVFHNIFSSLRVWDYCFKKLSLHLMPDAFILMVHMLFGAIVVALNRLSISG